MKGELAISTETNNATVHGHDESLLGLPSIVVRILRRYFAGRLGFEMVIFVEELLCVLAKGKRTIWWYQLKRED